ncbi:HlyD family efflux transporter periplasmic adaptor subunit [Granulosicoccaceae sp. 1_MG-2023]|nr:HlyD family efflux transporter periplasmic adaptor subunit [Granulosicoccaceae sp. 1_MG-2023]
MASTPDSTSSDSGAVNISPFMDTATRHPIKSARLLYSLPPFMLRSVIYLIFIVIFSALIYSFWATSTILVTAPMTLLKDSFTIQVTGDGLVTDLAVQANSVVRAGDPLATIQEQLRPFDNAQRDAIEGQRIELEKERDKLISEFDHRLSQLSFDLQDLSNNRGGRTEELGNQVRILEQQQATARNALNTARDSLGIAQNNYKRVNDLFVSRDVTVTERDQALERLNSAKKSVFDAESRVAEIGIALQTARSELAKFQDQLQTEKLQREIAQVTEQRKREISRLDEQIAGINRRLDQASNQEGATYIDNKATYSSFFDGVITEVHVNRGEMIRAGTPLVTLVRDTAVLEAHAWVSNQDIGRLKRGQEVKIKYFAYPYQEYGIARGLTSFIATTPGGAPGRETMYLIKVALEKDTISRPGGAIKPLEIGLEGIAEFKTGEKRFIEILFSPISRFFQAEDADDPAAGGPAPY